MEVRRKREEEERKRQEEADRKAAVSLCFYFQFEEIMNLGRGFHV